MVNKVSGFPSVTVENLNIQKSRGDQEVVMMMVVAKGREYPGWSHPGTGTDQRTKVDWPT